jgi:glyoxylase-like metal-dependent hydrolase (beta-lactamase superfamily II)
LILPTHGHWDHAGSVAELKSATGAKTAIHRADADLVRHGINGPLKPTNLTGRLILPFTNAAYPPFEPDLLIEDEIDLTEFGVAAHVLFTPGHTPGSLSVRTAEGEMIVGDLVMGGWFGGWLFPSRPGLHYYADDLTKLRDSVHKMLAAAPTVIHPGHGGPLDPHAVARRFT